MHTPFADKLNDQFNQAGEIALVKEYVSTRDPKIRSQSATTFNTVAKRLATSLTQLADYSVSPAKTRSCLLILDAGFSFVTAMLAAFYAGISIIPCPHPSREADKSRFKAIVKDSACQFILGQQRDLPLLASLAEDCRIYAMEELLDQAQQQPPLTTFRSFLHDIAVIQYSSGSTQLPKGVLVTQQMILANHLFIQKRWNLSSETGYLTWLPHYHDMGLFGGIIFGLLSGSPLLLMSPSEFIKRPSRWFTLIAEHNIYLSGGPPFAYDIARQCTPDSVIKKLDLSSWKVAYCGADYVPQSVKTQLVEKLAPTQFDPHAFFACYGMAEIVLFAGGERFEGDIPTAVQQRSDHLLPSYLGEQPDNIGIFDQNNQLLAEGEEGQVCIKGDYIGERYLSADIPSFIHDNQRWIKTGDIGILQDNWLTISGRLKDIVKVRGKNIHPVDLAVAANQQFPELNQHAFFLSQDIQQDELHFTIETWKSTPATNAEQMANELTILFSDSFGVFIKQIDILPRNSLPRTSSGKIKRWAVR